MASKNNPPQLLPETSPLLQKFQKKQKIPTFAYSETKETVVWIF